MGEHGCWLVADVGGTRTRLGLVDPGAKGLAILEQRSFATGDFGSLEAVIERYLEDVNTRGMPEAACLAVAGPVHGPEAVLTNGEWTISCARVSERFALPEVLLVNDFHAVAASIPQLADGDLYPIGAAVGGGPGPKVVLGPGTGLGMAALVPVEGDWRVIASEGGHAPLAPVDELELEVTRLLLERFGFVTWEHALSGPGLENLYRAVAAIWGVSGEALRAPDITAGALEHEPVCHQTLELFCSMLGTAAGGLAYTLCAAGGVYLAGGILPRFPEFLAASHFRERFEAVGGTDYLRPVATRLIMTGDVGLRGAAVTLARQRGHEA